MQGNAPCIHVDGEFCDLCWPQKENPVLTLDEARKMTYEQLQKACKEFNKNVLSAEDIQKAWDDRWKNGFETAINLVKKVVDNSPEKEAEALWYEIMEEVELYKKDV